jgi:hypothetical protein
MYRLLVVKPEGKRRLGRPRRRWIFNIKMDLLEIELGGMDWTDLAQVETSCNELSGSIKMLVNYRVVHNLWPLEWYSAPQCWYVSSHQIRRIALYRHVSDTLALSV